MRMSAAIAYKRVSCDDEMARSEFSVSNILQRKKLTYAIVCCMATLGYATVGSFTIAPQRS